MHMTPDMNHIRKLITTGVLRDDITRSQLFDLLGPPEGEGGESRKYPHSSIYKYGVVQFVFPPCRSEPEMSRQQLKYAYIDDHQEDVEPVVVLGQFP